MTGSVTLQELFDSQASFRPKDAGLLFNDFDKLFEDHKHETMNDDWSASYYEDLKAVADKYDLKYDVPKHLGNLSLAGGVGTPVTLH